MYLRVLVKSDLSVLCLNSMEKISLDQLYSILSIPVDAQKEFTKFKIDIEYITNLFYQDEDKFFELLDRDYKEKYLEILYIYLNLAIKLYDMYIENGVDLKIYFDTIDDIRIWAETCVKETGTYGLKEIYWLNEHLRMRLYKLGRLQFQKRENSEFMGILREHNLDKYVKSNYFYFVHIPEGERLSYELVQDSYKRAVEFYKDDMIFAAESWILSDKMDLLFAPDSNLMKFKNDFIVLSSITDENHIKRYLKEGSSLLEKVIQLEEKGIMIGEAFGICLKYVKEQL